MMFLNLIHISIVPNFGLAALMCFCIESYVHCTLFCNVPFVHVSFYLFLLELVVVGLCVCVRATYVEDNLSIAGLIH